jgi:hypothetical protein
MKKIFSKPHLGAFFAPQKTQVFQEVSNCRKAAITSWIQAVDPGVEFCAAKLQKQNRNAVLRPYHGNGYNSRLFSSIFFCA